MTRLEALKEVAEKVGAGELGRYDIAGACYRIEPLHEWRREVGKAYDGSFDAALALHEAVLPGWFVEIQYWTAHKPPIAKVTIGNSHSGSADTPARALFLADCRALIAQEEAQ